MMERFRRIQQDAGGILCATSIMRLACFVKRSIRDAQLDKSHESTASLGWGGQAKEEPSHA